MDKINNIITISGEPVSGKGTTVKAMVRELEKRGYNSENIHVVATGEQFRNYFNQIIELIRNYDNIEKSSELSESEILKKIMKNPEYRERMILTIKELKKNNIDLCKFNIADANNSEYFSGVRSIIDFLIDDNIEKLGKQYGKEDSDDVWIIDSRLAFYNIPKAFSVRLTANSRVAGERLFNDSSRSDEDKYATIEEAEREREERRIGEIQRYKERYGVDLENEDNYNLIIDGSFSSIEDNVEVILDMWENLKKDKTFGKKWASIFQMLPLQDIRQTFCGGESYKDLEEFKDILLEKGYDPESEISVTKAKGRMYIKDGNHRVFARLLSGKNLIPYYVAESDMDTYEESRKFAINRANAIRLSGLFDYEDLIERVLRELNEDPSLKFSYNNIYQGFIEELVEKNER